MISRSAHQPSTSVHFLGLFFVNMSTEVHHFSRVGLLVLQHAEIIHRYIVSLSLSRPIFYHVSATSHFQSAGPRRPAGSVQVPDVLTSDTTVSASSSGPVLPTSYLVRDSERIGLTASEALIVLQEGPRASESSLLAETIPDKKTQDIPQTPDVPQPSDISQDFEVIIPCKTTAADASRSRRPQQLHCHSTPRLWMRYRTLCTWITSLGTQYVSPVFGKLPHPAGQTLSTQADHSLHKLSGDEVRGRAPAENSFSVI